MKEKYRLTVFSDSHGSSGALREAIELHRRDTDCFIFLGDGCREAVPLLEDCGKAYQVVPGNCDMFVGGMPESLTLDLGAARIFICHGHRYGADIALFGHTHLRLDRYLPPERDGERPLWLFNPGSISRPREGRPSYGIIDILRDGERLDVLLSHAEL